MIWRTLLALRRARHVGHVRGRPLHDAHPVQPVAQRPQGHDIRRGTQHGPFGDAINCAMFNRWQYGLEGRVDYSGSVPEADLRVRLLGRPVSYLVGGLEMPQSPALDRSCPAMAQGPSRLAGAQGFVARLARHGLGVTLRVVPECGHNQRCVMASDIALPFPFPATSGAGAKSPDAADGRLFR